MTWSRVLGEAGVMTLSMHALTVETFAPMLTSLSEVIDKGIEHARTSSAEPDELLRARLAPDMYTLSTQVQLACHHALDVTARLLGDEPPALEKPDSDTTMRAVKARLASTIERLRRISKSALDGTEDRSTPLLLANDTMIYDAKGFELVRDWALPHFYFHVVTAYDILRHQGVEIGKRDYLSRIGSVIRPRT